MRLGSFHVEINFQTGGDSRVGRVDEFQITLTTLHEMDHLEVQIEGAPSELAKISPNQAVFSTHTISEQDAP